MFDKKDFYNFATHNAGVNGLALSQYMGGNYINPTIIEERPLNVAQMDVFSRLMYERTIWLGSGIDSMVANIINAQLLYLASTSDDDIKLYINSPGGSVYDGLSIYDVMNFITPNVETTCVGTSASMGAVLLSSGTKGKRKSLPHSIIMLHEPMAGINPGTKCTDFMIEAEQMKKCKDILFEILCENCDKTIDEMNIACSHDKWFTPQEALNFGVIDEIIN